MLSSRAHRKPRIHHRHGAIGAECEQDTGRRNISEPIHLRRANCAQPLLIHATGSAPERVKHRLHACRYTKLIHRSDVIVIEHLGMLQPMCAHSDRLGPTPTGGRAKAIHHDVGRFVSNDMEACLQSSFSGF